MAKRKADKDAAADEAVAAEEQVEGQAEEQGGEQAGDAGAAPEVAASEEAGTQIQQQITIDDSSVDAGYANFCRVSSTPEELILDLGLNPTPFASGEITVNLSQRVIMNHITAKRLLGLLSATLQRHEQAFGVIETDVRRRVRPQG